MTPAEVVDATYFPAGQVPTAATVCPAVNVTSVTSAALTFSGVHDTPDVVVPVTTSPAPQVPATTSPETLEEGIGFPTQSPLLLTTVFEVTAIEPPVKAPLAVIPPEALIVPEELIGPCEDIAPFDVMEFAENPPFATRAFGIEIGRAHV